MKDIKNKRLINALLRKPVDRTPVWLMRQAGRYLPEYRKLRAGVPDFMTFCRTSELACEATLQPLERFALDAAIVFSDILTVPAAMGMDLQFAAGEGPIIHSPIRSMRDVEALSMPEVEDDLGYVMKTLSLVSHELDGRVPLIGFAGSPWTVGAYMVEGRGGLGFPTMLKMAEEAPDVMHALLTRLADVTTHYLNAQIKAGAQTIMLFDTWGGLLSSSTYPIFSLQYMARIAKGLTREVNGERIPLIFFTKGSRAWLEQIADAGCDAVGLDAFTPIGEARERVGDRVALQGNLDPQVLLTNPDAVQKNVKSILQDYGAGTGHVFNLGHGIDKTTPIEHVAALVEAVVGV